MRDLTAHFSPDVVAAIEALVAERVEQALAGDRGPARSPWLSIPDAAAYLDVSESTVERCVAAGRLRSSTLGRRRLLHRDDLDRLAREGDGGGVARTAPPRRRGVS